MGVGVNMSYIDYGVGIGMLSKELKEEAKNRERNNRGATVYP